MLFSGSMPSASISAGGSVFCGIPPVLAHGDGVQVGKRVHAFIVVLQRDEVLQRAEVVAEREHARRLNHAQNALLFVSGVVFTVFSMVIFLSDILYFPPSRGWSRQAA